MVLQILFIAYYNKNNNKHSFSIYKRKKTFPQNVRSPKTANGCSPISHN